MWGEDSSGRKVSLLNNNNTISTTTTTTTTSTNSPSPSSSSPSRNRFSRPTLPARSRGSEYSSSSSTASRSSYQCSSRSSFSRSPGHSPPTPPLTRLDSFSSISTKSSLASLASPMNSQFGFEPSDPKQQQHHVHPTHPHQQHHSLPFYGSNFNKAPIPFPTQDPTQPAPYYQLPGQQPLPPLTPLELEDPYPHPNALHKIHTSPNGLPLPTSLSPTNQAHHLISPAPALLPTATTIPTLQTAHLPTAPVPDAANLTGTPTSTTAKSASSSTKTPTTPSNPTGPKKKYPCPHAAAFGCTDTFTTSGHAARHGKKHTGEKNVHCPTCNKAFTRKDNMKQHERTHKSGSGGAGSNSSSSHPAPSSSSSHPHGVVAAGTPGSVSTRGASSAGSSSASPATNQITPTAAAPGTMSMPSRSRRTSAAAGDAMDIDSTASPVNGTTVAERPKMQRSELSEILETVNNAGMGMGVGVGVGGATLAPEELVNAVAMAAPVADLGPEVTGDSPLDALAIAAASGAVV